MFSCFLEVMSCRHLMIRICFLWILMVIAVEAWNIIHFPFIRELPIFLSSLLSPVSIPNTHPFLIADSQPAIISTSSSSTLNKRSFLATDLPKVKKSRPSQWELLRQKRTAAIKDLQQKGFVQIDTDNDLGKQVLSFPWIPDQKIPYKQLSPKQRLINEVSAGAIGEITKDSLLHWVDTLKTLKQAEKKKQIDLVPPTPEPMNTTYIAPSDVAATFGSESQTSLLPSKLMPTHFFSQFNLKSLYAGFPIVALASIPQGGSFFLVKKGLLEVQQQFLPQFGSDNLIVSVLSITTGVMIYWLFRTPAELIKTQVQTKQEASVLEFGRKLLTTSSNERLTVDETEKTPFEIRIHRILNLWKYYPIMLSLDIPFQIINFILYGLINNYLQSQSITQTIWIRLAVGIGCGTVAAFATCPLDVGKTRILARDKQESQLAQSTSSTSDDMDTEESVRFQKEHEKEKKSSNMISEVISIFQTEGLSSLFLGLRPRLLYTGLANGIRLAVYGSSRMDLMMKALDEM